jgi:hypothetical protein
VNPSVHDRGRRRFQIERQLIAHALLPSRGLGDCSSESLPVAEIVRRRHRCESDLVDRLEQHVDAFAHLEPR